MQLDGTVHSRIRFAGRIPASGESTALHTARWHGEGEHAAELQCAPGLGAGGGVVLKWLEWECELSGGYRVTLASVHI